MGCLDPLLYGLICWNSFFVFSVIFLFCFTCSILLHSSSSPVHIGTILFCHFLFSLEMIDEYYLILPSKGIIHQSYCPTK